MPVNHRPTRRATTSLRHSGEQAMRIRSWGHAAFAVMMIVFGIMGLIKGTFPPMWTGIPKAFPARDALAYLCSAISVATGVGLLIERTALNAARSLLGAFLLWLL